MSSVYEKRNGKYAEWHGFEDQGHFESFSLDGYDFEDDLPIFSFKFKNVEDFNSAYFLVNDYFVNEDNSTMD